MPIPIVNEPLGIGNSTLDHVLNGFERPPDSVNTGLKRDLCDILIIGDVNVACVQYM